MENVFFENGNFYIKVDDRLLRIDFPVVGGGGGGIGKGAVNILIKQFVNNRIKTKRVLHTITQEEIDNKVFTVDVIWDTPFLDTNYTTTWSVNDLVLQPNGFDFIPVDMHDLTNAGFTANLFLGSDSSTVSPGDQVIVNAIAIHD